MDNELNLNEAQVAEMVVNTVRGMVTPFTADEVKLTASDSYGDRAHRTWAFFIKGGTAFGSIERYWGGLKMICSVLGGSPRTSFFNEDGSRTTNKKLRGNQPAKEE